MEYIKTTKVIKTGTSLCVVIPKNYLSAIGLVRGDLVVWGVASSDVLYLRRVSEIDIKNLKPPQI